MYISSTGLIILSVFLILITFIYSFQLKNLKRKFISGILIGIITGAFMNILFIIKFWDFLDYDAPIEVFINKPVITVFYCCLISATGAFLNVLLSREVL